MPELPTSRRSRRLNAKPKDTAPDADRTNLRPAKSRRPLSQHHANRELEHRASTIKAAGAHKCLARLQRFGFAAASVEWIRSLDSIKEKVLLDFLETWENEYNQAIRGTASPFQTAVPSFLKRLDAATPEQTNDAARLGAGARIAGHVETDNPFPPGTVLRSVWKQAFTSGTARKQSQDALAQLLDRPTTISSTRTDSLRQTTGTVNQQFDPPQRNNRECRQHTHIEHLRTDLENLMDQSRHHRTRIRQLETELNQTKNQWDTVVNQAEQAAEKLMLARAGLFHDATLNTTAPKPSTTPSHTPRDSTSRLNPRHNPRGPVPAPSKVPVDHGATFKLECLERGALQKITNCDPRWGLSPQQVARLKHATNGHTVADLEKFQRETFNWQQAIPGFGESAINRLQDAHLAFRIKYDIPSSPKHQTTSNNS